MRIKYNESAVIAGAALSSTESKFNVSSERLSTGFKINHARENPSGIAIGKRMSAQIKSLGEAHQTASNAVSVVNTAEGAMTEIQAMVQRINELAVQAANGTKTDEDRASIQAEVKQLKEEGNDIILLGEMGIGNTTTATAVSCAILKLDPDKVTGRGAGLTDDKLKHKCDVIDEALKKYEYDTADTMKILTLFGGYDIAAMAGAIMAGAELHVPIVLDGLITLTAASCQLNDIKSYGDRCPTDKNSQFDRAYLVCYGTDAAGILLGNAASDGSIDVKIDYTTPVYRDCSAGKHLYAYLASQHIPAIFANTNSEIHRKYLLKMGFSERNGHFEKKLA